MTVGEPKAILEGVDDRLPVHIAYCYGDYGKTEVAPEADEAHVTNVHFSSYHDMDKLADDESEEATEGRPLRAVLVIR